MVENRELILVIAVAFVVAIGVSLATVNITGNVANGLTGNWIKVNPDVNGINNVYIKGEIDKKIANLSLNCSTTYATSVGQTGNSLCNSMNKRCVFSYSTIYSVIKNSNDGSCSGSTNWMLVEPYNNGVMFEPSDCSSGSGGAAIFTIPAFNGELPIESGSCNSFSCCFKGAQNGKDVWVSKQKTHRVALCC
jgi:hypothetical protein